ncbi:DEAD/DEAH box helicase [Celerinatantimonas yamalensis]|uniref:DEAD/DEAH box helicase n=1 Tax=Celerinatantimonas yamalensis TaxID=559956 RepID=A0ABW9G2H1_9GAMM
MSFAELGLSKPITEAISEMGYTSPTPIQAQSIPAILQGKDVLAAAQTGTGKTAAFVLPILEQLRSQPRASNKEVKALIITPTRELAAQIDANVKAYAKHLKLRHQVVFGGVNIKPQIRQLVLGCDVLTATPGRLLDLYGQGMLDLSKLQILVLDEADRMLDMGFIHDIRKLIKLLPKKRQNLLFSATFAGEIRKLAHGLLNQPVEVSVDQENRTARQVEQFYTLVDQEQKTSLIKSLIVQNGWQQVLVFTRTKHGANRLTQKLEQAKINAAAIHGNKSQNARVKALEGFKDGSIEVLVATDIAARGLDIKQLPQIVNFDLPNVAEDYVHRIGRTGRAGESGTAYSLVSQDQLPHLQDIEKFTKSKLNVLEIDGFKASFSRSAKTPAATRQAPRRQSKPQQQRSGKPARPRQTQRQER